MVEDMLHHGRGVQPPQIIATMTTPVAQTDPLIAFKHLHP